MHLVQTGAGCWDQPSCSYLMADRLLRECLLLMLDLVRENTLPVREDLIQLLSMELFLLVASQPLFDSSRCRSKNSPPCHHLSFGMG